MKSRRHIARLIAASVLVVGAGVVATPGGISPVQAAACTTPGGLCGGGEFHPLPPARIFDSRPGLAVNDVAPPGAKPLAAPEPATFDIALLGKGGIPTDAANVLAVVVNITVTEPGANGYLEAYGKGAQPAQHTSIINFGPGQTVPNVAIVRPGTDGALTIGLYGLSGTANVLVDVFGWFSTSAYTVGDGARLIPTTPSRILDTRDGTNRTPAGPLGAGETMTLQILGADGVSPAVNNVVPETGVTGVLLNVVGLTTEAGGTATHLSLFPDDIGGAAPGTSNLNLAANVIKANLVFVPVGTDGKVRIYNNSGNTQVVADVVGLHADTAIRHDPSRSSRAADVAVPHVRHSPAQLRWCCTRAGAGRGLELLRLRQLGVRWLCIGRRTARRDRQPHVGRAEAPVPVAARSVVPHRVSIRCTATDLVEPQHHRGAAGPEHGGVQVRGQRNGAGVQQRRLHALPLRRLSSDSRRRLGLDCRVPTG